MPLERKSPEDRSARWRPRKSVRLYLDELDRIIKIMEVVGSPVLADVGDFAGPIVSGDDLRIGDLERLKTCSLTAGPADRSIKVTIGPMAEVEIAAEDDLGLTGASTRVQEVLNSCRRAAGGIGNRPDGSLSIPAVLALALFLTGVIVGLAVLTSGGSGTSGAAVASAGSTAHTSDVLVRVLALVAVVLGVGLGAGAALVGPNAYPKGIVILAYRIEAPSWWTRNGTSVIIGLVTSTIVGVFFFWLGRITS